jgi:hypothetical protein
VQEVWSNIEEREKHKVTPLHLCMGKGKRRCAHLFVANRYEIEIDKPGSPARFALPISAELSLDFQKLFENLGAGKVGLSRQRRI